MKPRYFFIPLEIILRRLRRVLPLGNNPCGDSNTPRGFLTGFIAFFLILPNFTIAGVVINEIAWMGTVPKEGESISAAANNEWIELYNSGNEEVSLGGWRLVSEDGMPDILLSGSIAGNGYFLLERAHDDVVVSIPADLVYSYKNNALSNSGERLFLKNTSGIVVDEVNMAGGWTVGDNDTKETMQKNADGEWITAKGTPRASGTGAVSVLPPPLLPQEQQNGAQSAAVVVFPEIYADAGNDRVVAVGSDVRFIGMALGIKKEPLEQARFLWNFGDGETGDGKTISHTYKIPGSYRVGLHIASGGFTASDYITVLVEPNKIEIGEVLYGTEGYIRIKNPSAFDINIGGWSIEDGSGKVFLIPNHTHLGKNSEIALANETTGLLLGTEHLSFIIRYPNGREALAHFAEDDKSLNSSSDHTRKAPEPLRVTKQIPPTSFYKKEKIIAPPPLHKTAAPNPPRPPLELERGMEEMGDNRATYE